MDSVIHLLNKWDLEFRRGELKDIHEGQGDYCPYKEAQPIRSWSCVASDVVSSLAGRPRYVTDDCFIQLAPQLFISFTFGSLSLTWSAAIQISWTKRFFLRKKRVQSTQAAFFMFLYTNMAALTSYETTLWFKYSSLPLYCKKKIKNQQMNENYDSGIGVCTMKDQHFLSPLCCFVFYT